MLYNKPTRLHIFFASPPNYGKLVFKIFIWMLTLMIASLVFPHASFALEKEPYMPASIEKVLQDVGAAPDVRAIVSGGWGYSQEGAMVIANPHKGKTKEFKIQPFEYELMNVRDQEEFYIVPPDGERYLPLYANLINQIQINAKNGKKYDKLQMQLTVLPEQYWPEYKTLVDAKKSKSEIAAHFKTKALEVMREYWFDVTEPLLHNGKVLLNSINAK